MASTYMLRKHLATIEAAGKPEAIAERKLNQEACKRATADWEARYPVVTPDNFEEVDEYRKERIAFWKKHLATA